MSAFFRRQVMRLYERATSRRIYTIMNQLNRNQWLSREVLLKLQQQKLYNILTYAYQYVPYYQRAFAQVGFHPAEILTNMGNLSKVPILTKPLIKESFDDLLTTEAHRRAELRRLSTSGSTGQPLIFMQDSNFRDYFTAYVHHHLSWGGWKLGQPHAYVGGASFEATGHKSLRDRLMDWTWNRFAMNAYAFSDETMLQFANKIRQRHPILLYGYASSIFYFAQFIKENNFTDIHFKSIFSSAEVLYPDQRHFIEETFKTQVFDRYATRELGEVGSQCEAQTGFHVSLENVYVEIINDEGQPTQPGEPGHIIVTNLNNYGMPFIRYNLADVIAWHPDNSCSCGRKHPMLSVVEGRHNDMFKTRTGRTVWGGITNPLWDVENVKQFQFIQKNYDLVVVRIVKEGELSSDTLNRVQKAVQAALDEGVEVRFEFPNEIPTEKSGKYRYQICEIDTSPLAIPEKPFSNPENFSKS